MRAESRSTSISKAATTASRSTLVRDLAPAELRSRAYGYYHFVLGISAVPAGLLTGWLWDAVSPLAALCAGAGIAGVASGALVVWSLRQRRTR
jgi:MFS family permease